MKKTALMGIRVLLFSLFLTPAGFSGENRFRVGFQAGPFIPADWQIQGQSETGHGGDNFPNIQFSGFGNGTDLLLSIQYDFSSWGIRAESGVRLYETRKLISGTLGLPVKYENRMQVVPAVFSLVRQVRLNDPKLTPYFGIGGGSYFIDMQTKYSISAFPNSGTWLKESKILLGFHTLAGFDYRVYDELFANFEYGYDFAVGDFRLDNVDNDDYINIYDLNLGGTSLRFGVGYRF